MCKLAFAARVLLAPLLEVNSFAAQHGFIGFPHDGDFGGDGDGVVMTDDDRAGVDGGEHAQDDG